ncbi:hypothetical protein INS49_004261 [Diaporthe citri]|uniref:uncharacterized protein n=1 Tax=Diaporthe citri TaxID=83186 RepID=UPI001C805903|nr:uncharacterized protein INS49_004261 [Diaporthe citri]KAG6355180.1 hypothetical protein INS49_004261 [Diaporthe citri]
MLFQPTITLLLASLAIAAPGKSQSLQTVTVTFINTHLGVVHGLQIPADGRVVAVEAAFTNRLVDHVMIKCLDICIPEFQCTLYDENSDPLITLPPGSTAIDPPQRVHEVTCKGGLPGDEPRPIEARESHKQDLSIWLNAGVWAVSTEVRPSVDGVFHSVSDFDYFITSVLVNCLGDCVTEFHCRLYNKDLVYFMAVYPGRNQVDPPQQVRKLVCVSGPPGDEPGLIEARESDKKILHVSLYAHILGKSTEVWPAIDGDAVPVQGHFGYPVGSVLIQCLGECIPKYHCTLFDNNLEAFATVSGEGGKVQEAQPVRQVRCASGPPPQ